MVWINLIQSNTVHCAKLGLVRMQNSYIDAASAQVFAPGLFGGFSFGGLKKLKGGDSWIHSTAQRKEHSKTEFEKRELWVWVWGIETFHRSKIDLATCVTRFPVDSPWPNLLSQPITPVAGLIFETKIERYFLESFCLERNYCPRTGFSGSNSCSILSHPVISWNESRADPCTLGRIHYCPKCSLLGNEGTPQILNASFWKRGRENVFLQMF